MNPIDHAMGCKIGTEARKRIDFEMVGQGYEPDTDGVPYAFDVFEPECACLACQMDISRLITSAVMAEAVLRGHPDVILECVKCRAMSGELRRAIAEPPGNCEELTADSYTPEYVEQEGPKIFGWYAQNLVLALTAGRALGDVYAAIKRHIVAYEQEQVDEHKREVVQDLMRN